MKVFVVAPHESGRTILKYVEAILKDVPKSRIERLFRNRDLRLNYKRIRSKQVRVQAGDKIIIYGVVSTWKRDFHQTKMALEVIYEDRNLLVVSKRAGIATNGTHPALDDEVLNYLEFRSQGSFVPSSIGRLDKATSGLIIYGKNYQALAQMKAKQNNWTKIYVFKSDLPASITTTYRFADDKTYQRQKHDPQGQATKTIFTVTPSYKRAQIITGRKHQIRASLATLGFPIYGDLKYGGLPAQRVFLHCTKLVLCGLDGDLAYLNNKTFTHKPPW